MLELFRSIDEMSPRHFEGRRITLPIGMSYMRLCGLFQGVRALVADGLAHEALLIGRPLYEEGLRLHHLAQLDTATRDGQTAYWYGDNLTRDEGLVRIAALTPDKAAAVIEHLQDTKAEFSAI
jgi:hypothetical protein